MDQEKVREVLEWVRDRSTHSAVCVALRSSAAACGCGWEDAYAAAMLLGDE